MKVFAIFCIFLVLSNQLNLRKGFDDNNSPVEQLRKIKEVSQFAANMINNVELHLQTGGKVDEVIQFVQEALTDSQQELSDTRAEAAGEETRIQNLVSGYESEVTRLTTDFTNTVASVAQLNVEIAQLQDTVSRLQADLSDLNTREQALSEARQNDEDGYAARKQRDENTVQVLEEVLLPALYNLVETGGAFLEKSEHDVKFALDKITKKNSLQAFIELTTQFNEAKVRQVIAKMTEVLESVKESKASDFQEEARTSSKFDALMSEINRLREFKGAELAETKSTLETKQQQVDTLTMQRDNLTANIQTTSDIRDATLSIQTNTVNSYAQKVADGSAAVEALRAALNILTENETSLQEQEVAASGQ